MGSFYTTQIAHQVLCDNERQGGVGVEGGSRGRGHMYTYG